MKTRLGFVLAAMLVLTFVLLGQYPWAFSNPPRNLFSAGPICIPVGAADLATTTASVDLITLTNVTDGAITVTIADKSTNCNSGVCQLLSTVSIAARATYVIEMRGGWNAVGGVTWVASAANSIVGYLRGVKF